MRWLYNLAYLILLVIASPWLVYRSWTTGRYRDGFSEKFFGSVPLPYATGKRVWFHAVSVGEVNLIKPIVSRFESDYPDWKITISVGTNTGKALADSLYAKHHVIYAPLDFSWAVTRAFQRIEPSLVVLAELEIWPNYIGIARSRQVPVVVVNGRISDKSYRGYRRFQWLLGSVFRSLSKVAAQDEASACRFRELCGSDENVVETGSVKFDGANDDRNAEPILSRRHQFGLEDRRKLVWVVGSTQAPEEEICLRVFRQLRRAGHAVRMIIVPRHQERFREVRQYLQTSEFHLTTRSECDPDQQYCDWDILLGDTIGELKWWWAMADIAFVGGSFGNRGGQNMIEPCAYGASVSFGPNTKNFRSIVKDLLAAKAATELHSEAELYDWANQMLSSSELRVEFGKRARELIQRNRGAVERTMTVIRGVIQ